MTKKITRTFSPEHPSTAQVNSAMMATHKALDLQAPGVYSFDEAGNYMAYDFGENGKATARWSLDDRRPYIDFEEMPAELQTRYISFFKSFLPRQ